ncbi:MAG: ABC transporter ATP-binding protein, partial [Planctomycetota bacterium]
MLDIRNLSVNYGHHPVLRDVSLQVRRKQTVGLVGESGTGKTTLGLSLLGLVEERTDSACVSGRIILGERDLMEMGAEELRRIRWNRISMVFQNSENALNPSMRIVQQVGEPLIAHDLAGTDEARDRAIEMLTEMDFPGNRIEAYPHELSEGEKQRAITAMAFICDPEIVILDEPTASLDAVTSSDLTRTLKDLCDDRVAMIITHDLATAAELADVTAVLYGGSIVEMSPTARFFGSPRHPYSRGLVRSFPDMTRAKDLQGIRGQAEFVRHGCPFYPRCTQSIDLCSREHPDLERYDDGASVACHRGGV